MTQDTSKGHEWINFPGGPPSDMYYKWCRRCGTLMAYSSYDSEDEYYEPGGRHGMVEGSKYFGLTTDPGCKPKGEFT